MDINYLIEFAAIAKHRSFTLAAEELCISQSSLSKHIQALEKELGVALFDRSTRNVVVSEFGKILLPLAEQATELHHDIASSVYDFVLKDRSRLKIASIPVMAQYDITGIIARFQALYPQIKLSVMESEGKDIPRMLEDNTCELAFTRNFNDDDTTFEFLKYRSDSLCAILPKSHPLSQHKEISLSQLKHENFLLLDKKTLLYEFCFNACVKAGFVPNVAYTGYRPENIIDFIVQKLGVSLMMRHQYMLFKNPDLCVVEITPIIESSICLTKCKDHKLSFAGKLFWDYVKTHNN